MTSTRLPGKILRPVLGKPLLHYQLERLQRVEEASDVIVVTTDKATDDAVVELCDDLGISSFRGSEDNVLERYDLAAMEFDVDTVVRVTGDCPLIDPSIVDKVISIFHSDEHAKFVTNSPEEHKGERRTYPRGMDVEVFSIMSLTEAYNEAKSAEDLEHVTAFFRSNRKRYPCSLVQSSVDRSQYRLTVDTAEDFELVRRILESLYPKNPRFTLADIDRVLQANPEWVKLNAGIKQKHK